jgi:acetyl-CoA carboxylase biotin carboxylase subunit
MPSPGKINWLHTPGGPGIRFDSHIYATYKVPPNYDSMIAKLISYGDTRETAIARMRQALDELVIDGIKTNIELHQKIIRNPAIKQGGFNIHYLEKMLKDEE